MREYRRLLENQGQSSPPGIAHYVAEIINRHFKNKTLKIIDVGCGTGKQMQLLKKLCSVNFEKINGIDWSPATIDFHKLNTIYNEVSLAKSSKIPFEDQSYDLSLCMENLEHLYDDESIFSIREMARISKYIIITTPLPQDCININFLINEISESLDDFTPINLDSFICLESAIHKSTIYPRSMLEAGFKFLDVNHGVYFAKSSGLNFSKIVSTGIKNINDYSILKKSNDLKHTYLRLLVDSLNLSLVIKNNQNFEYYKNSYFKKFLNNFIKIFR